jgi:glycosyltransferase involved in cell wall biosynthesis
VSAAAGDGAPAPMRLVFVYFGPFNVNSAIQAFHFGNELTDLGWTVTLAAVGDPETIRQVGEPRFRCITHHDLPQELERARRAGEPTIVCAWTPRENVRVATLDFTRRLSVPYVIHLEDNEAYLLEAAVRRSPAELRRLAPSEQERFTRPALIHPSRYLEFLRGAAGITMITADLNDFNVGDRPRHVARPGIDAERFDPDIEPVISREALGLDPDDFVIVYHGTVHYANQHEMLSLYLGVKLLQRRGRAVKLVRLGETDLGGVDPRSFGALRDGVIELGSVGWREIPGYLALADAFVQPGAADDFNRYRLPSKLPEFLAMGRPVVLPDCNIGHDLTEGENALLLREGNGLEIASRVELLLDDPDLRARLARGARRFALEHLNWHDNSVALARFLAEVHAAADTGARGDAGVPAGLAV